MSEEIKESEEIIIRSVEVKEILTAPPKWIYRWGTGIVFLLILIAIVLSNFIKYPDIVLGEIIITSSSPPVKLVSKSEGKIQKLLVANNQLIKPDDVLAVIENPSNFEHILQVEKITEILLNNIVLLESLKDLSITDNLNLGDITLQYLMFLKSYKDLKLYQEFNPQLKELVLLEKQLKEQNNLLNKYINQDNIYSEEHSLIERDFLRTQSLFDSKTISASEYENKKKEYLSSKRNVEQHKIMVSNTKITINNLETNKLQIKIQEFEQSNRLSQELINNLKTLQNQIRYWKQSYMLQSPIEGNVSFISIWSENQHIKLGEEVFKIVPMQKLNFVGKAKIPIQNSGKVKVGQSVNIKLNNYPFQEYGIIEGIVKNISEVPNQDKYNVDIELINGLESSYRKNLPYKEEMTGTVEVITEKLTVMERIFMQFRKILERK